MPGPTLTVEPYSGVKIVIASSSVLGWLILQGIILYSPLIYPSKSKDSLSTKSLPLLVSRFFDSFLWFSYLTNFNISLNSGVPATLTKSKVINSVLVNTAPISLIKAKPLSLSTTVLEPTASTGTNTM